MVKRMYSCIRRIPLADLPTVPDEDGERAATEAELDNMRIHIISREVGAVIAHCNGYYGDKWPGEEICGKEGANTGYLIRRAPSELRPKLFRARVFRAPGLRSDIEMAVSGRLAARVPATGKTSARPDDPGKAMAVLDEARRRAQDEDDPTQELIVPMNEVDDEDVVEQDTVVPVEIAGLTFRK